MSRLPCLSSCQYYFWTLFSVWSCYDNCALYDFWLTLLFLSFACWTRNILIIHQFYVFHSVQGISFVNSGWHNSKLSAFITLSSTLALPPKQEAKYIKINKIRSKKTLLRSRGTPRKYERVNSLEVPWIAYSMWILMFSLLSLKLLFFF